MADPTVTDDLFDTSSILPSDPIGDDGTPLEVLHDREYRVRAFRKRDDLLLIRGAVRDQKPPGLYIEIDPEPMTIHHMQIDLEIAFPTLEIVGADVRIETHPSASCPSIERHYDKLVGLSIARGFTHKVRELFGGPRDAPTPRRCCRRWPPWRSSACGRCRRRRPSGGGAHGAGTVTRAT
jgi:hypothetical protein